MDEEATNTMIPKIIHFCWFGNSPKSSEIIEYMNTWKILGDFDTIEWNDKNVKFDESPYLNNMYSKKKWAFVSDYVRLKALYEYGGLYLDTDVEILKPFDIFLNNEMFLGFINDCSLGTAIIGAKAKHPIIKEILDLYDEIVWNDDYTFFSLKSRPELKLKNNNDLFTFYFLNSDMEFILNGDIQYLKEVTIYPKTFFEVERIVGSGYSIHHCLGSWITKGDQNTKGILLKNAFKSLIQYFPLVNVEAIVTRYKIRKNLNRKPFYSEYLKHKNIKS